MSGTLPARDAGLENGLKGPNGRRRCRDSNFLFDQSHRLTLNPATHKKTYHIHYVFIVSISTGLDAVQRVGGGDSFTTRTRSQEHCSRKTMATLQSKDVRGVRAAQWALRQRSLRHTRGSATPTQWRAPGTMCKSSCGSSSG